MTSATRRTRHSLTLLGAALLLALLAPGRARADLFVSVQPAVTSVSAGGSGTFELILSNTGPSAVDIATFNYQLQIAETAPVMFTGVSSATSIQPYIFGVDGFGIGGIVGNDSGFNTLTVSDFLNNFVPPDVPVSLAAGGFASLGLVSFSVDAAAAPQDVAVLINNDIDFTFLAATNTGRIVPIAIDGVSPGTIRITGTSVPEPASLAMLTLGAAGLLATTRARWRRRRAD